MNFKLLLVVLVTVAASLAMGQGPLFGSSIGVDDASFPKDELKNGDKKQPALLSARPGQTVSLISRVIQLEVELSEKIEEINTKNRQSFEDQEEKIAMIRVRERNQAKLLNKTREEMEVLKTTNRDQSKRIDQLEQKLAILQNKPLSAPLIRFNTKDKAKNGGTNNVDDLLPKPLTPPSSCQDLQNLDYFLDGLYLVKNKQTKKIQTVFCQFSADNEVSQGFIGDVDVKTKSIHFYVQRNTIFNRAGAIIPFELERLNEGRAFNLVAGVFTVPVSGIYHFQVSAIKLNTVKYLSIYLQVNGVVISEAATNQPTKGSYDVVSLSASLRLVANDRVNLYNKEGVLCEDKISHQTHFSGWMVEEDLL